MVGFTVEVIKVKASFPWAIKAVVDGVARYRGFHYKKEALRELSDEWEHYHENNLRELVFKDREFMHNFNSAEELGIKEI